MSIGTPAYNAALAVITRQFTQCVTNTANTNQSSLNQIRTNEIALSSPWELREFKLLNTAPVHSLKMLTVKRTPANKYNAQVQKNINVKRLANWVNANTAAYLLAQDNGIPLPDSVANPGPLTPFVGGHTFTQFPPTGPPPSAFHWDADPFPGPDSINNPLVRHYFSLNTCSECHGGETQTFFTHVTQPPWNTVAGLSGFLTGITVTDAANRPQPVPNKFTFADLKRRAIDMNKIVNCPCSGFRGLLQKLFFSPLGNVH